MDWKKAWYFTQKKKLGTCFFFSMDKSVTKLYRLKIIDYLNINII